MNQSIVKLEDIQKFREQREHARQCFENAAVNYAEGYMALYKIIQTKSYKAEFETQTDFLADFSGDLKDASRTLMLDMSRSIKRMKIGLGWPDDKIKEALEAPTAMQDALLKTGKWERGTGKLLGLANGVKPPIIITEDGSEPTDAEVVGVIVDDAIALGRGEARKMISEVAGELQIYAILKEASGTTAITVVDDDEGERYEFFCRERVNEGVRSWLERRLGARFDG